jgi:hypothetical protein
MVGRSGTQSPKGATMALQWDGDLHDVEHLEGKREKDFSRHNYGYSTSGPQSLGGHRYAL